MVVSLPRTRGKGKEAFAVAGAVSTTGDRAWLVRREGGEAHLVEWSPWGLWRCDCPAWKYRSGKCRHINAVLKATEGAT